MYRAAVAGPKVIMNQKLAGGHSNTTAEGSPAVVGQALLGDLDGRVETADRLDRAALVLSPSKSYARQFVESIPATL